MEDGRDNRGHIRPTVWNCTLRTCDRLKKLSLDHFLLFIPPWHPVWATSAHWSKHTVFFLIENGAAEWRQWHLIYINHRSFIRGRFFSESVHEAAVEADRDRASSHSSPIIHTFNGFKLEVMSYFWLKLCQQSGPENTPWWGRLYCWCQSPWKWRTARLMLCFIAKECRYDAQASFSYRFGITPKDNGKPDMDS